MIRYGVISLEEMSARKFGRLKMKNPRPITPGSGKRTTWVCDCGREKEIIIHSVLQDGTESCGHCNDISVEAGSSFNDLTVKEYVTISPSSHRKIEFICKCGRETKSQFRYVYSGIVKSCGKCLTLSIEEMFKKFGRLRMKNPTEVLAGSNKMVEWACDCGQESRTSVTAVVSGRTKSCGKCYIYFSNKYGEEKDVIRALKTPIHPEQIPDWCPKALEVITNTSHPFRAECRLCSSEYTPKWSGIRLGKSLTCGCSSPRVSSGQGQIYNFIQSFISDTRLEEKMGGLQYDIFVPSKNLVIEYNGLKWHSKPESKIRDLEKYVNAKSLGLDFIMVYEDEWLYNKKKVESFLKNRLGLIVSKSLRPSVCKIGKIPASQADDLYEKYHYIGKSLSPINYGVFFNDQLIGCCSFKRPTRQSSHDWELTRMVANPDYRIRGIWSKIVKMFTREHQSISIVSFSDNRLFSGSVYEFMGFKQEGDIRQDYYWVKQNKRYHKSTLRKTEEEKLSGKTENQLREAQGYSKIWDLGKKRWVLRTKCETHGAPIVPGCEEHMT